MVDAIEVVEAPRLSEGERLLDAFVAPGKTFADVRRSASWWGPFVLSSLLSLLFCYTVLHKVGMTTLVDSAIHANSTLEDRISTASPEDAAHMRSGMEVQFRFMYVSPVFLLVVGAMAAGILFATVNFGLGGRATYGQVLAVWFYGTLPLVFLSLLTVAALWSGMSSDSFNIRNTIGTNIGYYLQDGTAPKWLVTLLSSVDVFAIWSAVLLALGLAEVGRIKRGAAAAVVFGWWAVYVLAQTGIAAAFG